MEVTVLNVREKVVSTTEVAPRYIGQIHHLLGMLEVNITHTN